MLLSNLLTFKLLILPLKKDHFTFLITKNIRFKRQKQVVYKQCAVNISSVKIHNNKYINKLDGLLNN